MENHKELDDQIRKCLKELASEEPSADFTSNILSVLQDEKRYGIQVVYTPIFSNFSWIMICSLSAVLMILGYNTENTGTAFSRFLNFLDDKPLSIIKLQNVEFISNSQIILYSSIALCCFVCLQVVLLRKNWSGRQVIC
jgi:hypothetical protein